MARERTTAPPPPSSTPRKGEWHRGGGGGVAVPAMNHTHAARRRTGGGTEERWGGAADTHKINTLFSTHTRTVERRGLRAPHPRGVCVRPTTMVPRVSRPDRAVAFARCPSELENVAARGRCRCCGRANAPAPVKQHAARNAHRSGGGGEEEKNINTRVPPGFLPFNLSAPRLFTTTERARKHRSLTAAIPFRVRPCPCPFTIFDNFKTRLSRSRRQLVISKYRSLLDVFA